MSTAVDVTVPDAVHAGDELLVTHNGEDLLVNVPAGCGPGDVITVDFPVTHGEGERTSSTVEVHVPLGAYAGDNFVVDFGGCNFDVTVPQNCGPGDIIDVELPASNVPPGRTVHGRQCGAEDAARPKVFATSSQCSSRRGSWDDEQLKQQLKQRVPLASHASRCDSRSSSPTAASAAASTAGSAAASTAEHGTYRIGQRVQVLRTNGDWSACFVVSFHRAPLAIATGHTHAASLPPTARALTALPRLLTCVLCAPMSRHVRHAHATRDA
jgi:hypothetical protein